MGRFKLKDHQSKISEKTGFQKLQDSINSIITLQAENLEKIAKGKEPEHPVSEKVWADVLKAIDKLDKFEQFDKIYNPQSPLQVGGDEETTVVQIKSMIGNPFEERSKFVKEKLLNGKTNL